MYWKRVDRLYVCAASHTDTIARLLKSDFKCWLSGRFFLVARGLWAVDLSEPAEYSLTEVYFAASQQIRRTILSDWGKKVYFAWGTGPMVGPMGIIEKGLNFFFRKEGSFKEHWLVQISDDIIIYIYNEASTNANY